MKNVNKKTIIILLIMVVLLIVFALILKRKKEKISLNKAESFNNEISAEIIQDETTGQFIIYDKKTENEIARGDEKTSLYIYTVDPDYDPKLPVIEENSDNIE